MWRARRRRRPEVDELVDVRDEDTIDLRSGASASADDYHCMTIHLNVAPVRDAASEAWEEAGSLVDYPSDLDEWRADRRRDDLVPGRLSATVLQVEGVDAPD